MTGPTPILQTMTPTVGILTGGPSLRMGRPKALIEVDGTTLLERTAAVAATVTNRIVLLGEPGFELPRLARPLRILPDMHPGIGPMAGLEALLSARPDDACMLLACDMPNLNSEPLKRLCDAIDAPETDAAACVTGEVTPRWHPCCAIYGPTVVGPLQAALNARQYAMTKLLSGLKAKAIRLRGQEERWVENWNAPSDLPPGRTA